MSRDKVKCALCDHRGHILVEHVVKKHGVDPVKYLEDNASSPLWSAYGFAKIQEHNGKPSVASTPRPRKLVEVAKLFPHFGGIRGEKVEGEYAIFDTAGPLTPKLDPLYLFPEEITLDILLTLRKPARNRVLVCGWSGTGKSTLGFNLAAICNAEVMEWNGDDQTQRPELIGHFDVKDGETVWVDGILPRAMRRGVWLIINELDLMDSHTVNIMKPLLEDPPRLTILENGGEVVRAHPDFRVLAFTNTFGRGDSTGLFVNANVQSDADMRRWSARFRLDYLREDEETALLQRYFPMVKEAKLRQFVDVANKVRDAFKVNKIDKTFSPAELVNWVENWQTFAKGIHHAARVSFLNSLEPDVQHAIGEMVNAVFGHENKPTTDVPPAEAVS